MINVPHILWGARIYTLSGLWSRTGVFCPESVKSIHLQILRSFSGLRLYEVLHLGKVGKLGKRCETLFPRSELPKVGSQNTKDFAIFSRGARYKFSQSRYAFSQGRHAFCQGREVFLQNQISLLLLLLLSVACRDYDLYQVLGEGSFGKVKVARHVSTSELVRVSALCVFLRLNTSDVDILACEKATEPH